MALCRIPVVRVLATFMRRARHVVHPERDFLWGRNGPRGAIGLSDGETESEDRGGDVGGGFRNLTESEER
jgi:hypothetical protein